MINLLMLLKVSDIWKLVPMEKADRTAILRIGAFGPGNKAQRTHVPYLVDSRQRGMSQDGPGQHQEKRCFCIALCHWSREIPAQRILGALGRWHLVSDQQRSGARILTRQSDVTFDVFLSDPPSSPPK